MITQLVIRNFKKFSSKDLTFSPGINVIRGDNEAGKSTIMAAILATLFTDVNTKSKSFFDGVLSWKTQSRDIYLEAHFVNPTASHTLVRDFAQQKQYLLNQSTNKKLEDFVQIQQALSRELNIPGDSVFRSTSFIRQSEIANIHFSSDLRSALQNISTVSPEGVNLETNLKELDRELQELQLGLNRPSKTPGLIKASNAELQLNSEKLQQLKDDWEQAQQSKLAGASSNSKLEEINSRIQAVEKLLDYHKKLEEGTKKLKLIDEQLQSITGVLNQFNQEALTLKQINAGLAIFKPFAAPGTDSDAERLVAIKQELQLLSENKAEALGQLQELEAAKQSNYQQVSEKDTRGSLIGNTGFLLLAIGTIIGLVGLVLSTQSLLLLAGGIVFSAAIIMLYLLVSKANKPSFQTTLPNEKRGEQNIIAAQLEKIATRQTAVQTELRQILARYGASDYNEFFSQKAKLATLLDEKLRVESKMEGQIGDKDLSITQTQQNALAKQKKELEETELTVEVRAATLSPNDYLKHRRELDMLLIEQKRLEKDSTISDVRSSDNQVSHIEILGLEEKVELLTQRVASFEKRAQVISHTLRLLRSAIANTSQSASDVISSQVEQYLPKLTLQRYQNLRLNHEYDLEVFSNELNDWIKPLGQLSLGTVDQIYFLARVGLAKTLLNGNLDYIFLDDPFITFDQQRLEQTKAILLDLVEHRPEKNLAAAQIFLFTHNDNYDSWGNLVQI